MIIGHLRHLFERFELYGIKDHKALTYVFVGNPNFHSARETRQMACVYEYTTDPHIMFQVTTVKPQTLHPGSQHCQFHIPVTSEEAAVSQADDKVLRCLQRPCASSLTNTIPLGFVYL